MWNLRWLLFWHWFQCWLLVVLHSTLLVWNPKQKTPGRRFKVNCFFWISKDGLILPWGFDQIFLQGPTQLQWRGYFRWRPAEVRCCELERSLANFRFSCWVAWGIWSLRFVICKVLLPGVCSNQGAGASGASVKKSIWATDPFSRCTVHWVLDSIVCTSKTQMFDSWKERNMRRFLETKKDSVAWRTWRPSWVKGAFLEG